MILPLCSVSGESELLKFHGGTGGQSSDSNRQHMSSGPQNRPFFRTVGKTYRIRNGYTVTLECSIENLGKSEIVPGRAAPGKILVIPKWVSSFKADTLYSCLPSSTTMFF